MPTSRSRPPRPATASRWRSTRPWAAAVPVVLVVTLAGCASGGHSLRTAAVAARAPTPVPSSASTELPAEDRLPGLDPTSPPALGSPAPPVPSARPTRPPAGSVPTAPAAIPSPAPTAAGCPDALPAHLADTGGDAQLITVVAPSAGATTATVTGWQHTRACWTPALGPWPARVGQSGITTAKREGDGATPAGLFSLGPTLYGNAPDPGTSLPYVALHCGDWWDEDTTSATYDTFQVVACGTRPAFDNGASEALWTYPQAYSSFAVIQANPRHVPGRGSAIFLHAGTGGPTIGCVSVDRAALVAALRWLRPGGAIAIGTAATIDRY